MTTPLQDQLQRTLGDSYVIERELGGGGMSRVFLAREVALGRRVVVKLVPPDLAGVVSIERFRREIQLAASLQHPHLVPVLTAGASEGLPYFTMPFQAGESLRERIVRDGPLPVRDVLAILRDVTQALAYAHANGVIHRDIKPDNILLTGGVAMVTDFGVAKAIGASGAESSNTSVGLALGTPAYMAPEQGTADPESDQRVDLYALGVVAYEMLCGKTLFPGRSPQQVLVAHAVETPKPVRELRPDAPPALAGLVARCLAKDPADRPGSARVVLEEIERIMSGAAPAGAASSRRRTAALVGGVVVVAALIAAAGYFVSGRRGAAVAAKDERSIAVLPFANTSGDQQNEYFGDGMADELITALNKVPGLRVAARSSAFSFKGKNDDVREIGRKLSVGTVLEGSVRRAGKRLRVNARLIDASNGYQMWADEYERDETDVFKVQDELTKAIVAALQLRLTASGGAAIEKRGTASVEAFNRYLEGRFFYEKRSEEGLVKAAQFFEGAIKLDSGYAAAYAGLAESYGLLGSFGFRAPLDMYPKAKPAALRALALDSMLAEGHTALGFIDLFYDFAYDSGYHELTRAIELNPQYAPARLFRSWYFMAVGKRDEAVQEIGRARALDPLSLIINTRFGTMLFFARQYDSAIVQLRHTLDLDSTYGLAHMQLSRAYLALHRCEEALREASVGGVGAGNYEGANLGFAAAACGDTALARRELALKLDQVEHHYVPADVVARLYAGLGDKEHALQWLETAYRQDTWSLMLLKVEPMYDNLRSEPRFQALVKKMRLP